MSTIAGHTLVPAESLEPGMMIDLEGDRYADPQWDDPSYETEYAVVDYVEESTREYVAVAFGDGEIITFPPRHMLAVATDD